MARRPFAFASLATITPLVLALAGCGTEPTEAPLGGTEHAKSTAVTVTAVTPDLAPQGATLAIEVAGSGFDQGSRVDFLRDGVVEPKLQVNRTTYRTNALLVVDLSVAIDAAPARYDVMVTTSRGKKGIGTERFAVTVPYETLDKSTAISASVTHVSTNGWLSGHIDFNNACSPYAQPVVWTPAGALLRLPLPAGTCAGITRGVNRDGAVVGTANISPSQKVAVRWTLDAGMHVAQTLPLLPSGYEAGPRSITSAGTISSTEGVALWSESAAWRLAPVPAGFTGCGKTMVNDAEQLSATCYTGLTNRAAFWSSVTAQPVVLPLPPGTTSAWVNAMSGTGVVVGYAEGSMSSAVRWVQSGGAWVAEVLPHIGFGARAMGVNDAGVVVGIARTRNGKWVPVYWTPGSSIRMLGTTSWGAGNAVAVSDGAVGFVVGGRVVTGKSVTDFFAVRWKP